MSTGEIEWWVKEVKTTRGFEKLFVRIYDAGPNPQEPTAARAFLEFHPIARMSAASDITQKYSTIEKARIVLSNRGWHKDLSGTVLETGPSLAPNQIVD